MNKCLMVVDKPEKIIIFSKGIKICSDKECHYFRIEDNKLIEMDG